METTKVIIFTHQETTKVFDSPGAVDGFLAEFLRENKLTAKDTKMFNYILGELKFADEGQLFAFPVEDRTGGEPDEQTIRLTVYHVRS